MKKLPKQIFLFFFFLISLNLSAQEKVDKLKDHKKFEPIQVVLSNGVALEAYKKKDRVQFFNSTIKIYSPQRKVTYLDAADYKSFSFRKFTYYSDNEHVYELHTKGARVDLFIKHYAVVTGYGQYTNTSYNEVFYVKKKEIPQFVEVEKKHFAEDFSEYFSDHEELSKKILQGKYSHKDIEQIVRVYNAAGNVN